MALSIKGIARQYQGHSGPLSVKTQIMNNQTGSVRQRLESLARRDVSFSMSECIYGWTAAFEQTWSHVIVRIRLNPDAGISAQTMTALRANWETTIQERWSDRWAIGRSGEVPCNLTFDVQWVNTSQHHNVRVRVGPAPTNMGTWDTNDTGAVASHEFGHMLGNVNEYVSATCPSRSPVNTGTIMDNNSNIIPARLLTAFATRVGSGIAPAI